MSRGVCSTCARDGKLCGHVIGLKMHFGTRYDTIRYGTGLALCVVRVSAASGDCGVVKIGTWKGGAVRVLFVGYKKELGAVDGVPYAKNWTRRGFRDRNIVVVWYGYHVTHRHHACTCVCRHSPIMRWERVRGVRPRGGLKFLSLLEPNEFSECDDNGRRYFIRSCEKEAEAVMVLQQRNEDTASAIDTW